MALLAFAALALLGALPGRSAPSRASAAAPARSTVLTRDTRSAVLWLRSPMPLMVRVPRGAFLMGSTELELLEASRLCRREPLGRQCGLDSFVNEMPPRQVEVQAFWLDRTEVTVEAYRRCAEAHVCRSVAYDHGATRFDHPDFPVSLVTWEDARRFCEFRGARLPTEVEFEYAARGGSRRVYPWGNTFHKRAANYGRLGLFTHDAQDGFIELARVGSFPSGKTPLGILDLAGNVAEWVEDALQPYAPAPGGSQAASDRVIRGGHYAKARAWLRGAARDSAPPETRAPYIGFRCAKSAQ